MKQKYNLIIGEEMAEDIKIKIGTAFQKPEQKMMEVLGRDVILSLIHI